MIRRPVLAPGLRALLHPSGQVQVGLSAEHRIRVPNEPAVRRTLAILERGEALPDTPEFRRTRSLLAGVLRDGDRLGRPGIDAGEAAAVALQHPISSEERLNARSLSRIRVLGSLGPDVAGLIAAAGLGSGSPPTAVLVLSCGEPDREQLDDLVRAGIAHLLVRATEGAILLGPFVVPGLGGCLRCWDLHQQALEPAYGALLTRAQHSARADGVAEPVFAALAWIALGWAVSDLVRHCEGEQATTLGAYVRITPDAAGYTLTPMSAHPACSCTWSAGAIVTSEVKPGDLEPPDQ